MRPWARLHVDYASPVDGKMIFVIIDTHSKWVEHSRQPHTVFSMSFVMPGH